MKVKIVPKNKILVVDTPQKIKTIIKDFDNKKNILACKINNKLFSLDTELKTDAEIELIKKDSENGKNIYLKTVGYLLTKAVEEISPETNCVIGHSLEDGFYYYFENKKPTDETLNEISKKIHQYIEKKLEINRIHLPYKNAIKVFKEKKQTSTLNFLKFNNWSMVELYQCENFIDYSYTPLVDNCEKLENFEIIKHKLGFVIKLKNNFDTGEHLEFKDRPLLYNVYKEYKNYTEILQAKNVGDINNIIESKKIEDFIRVDETLQENKISSIALDIYKKIDNIKAVTLAGPSSSGKTTTTKRLATQLNVLGIKTKLISTDDYFIPRRLLKLEPDGSYDFETIDAIDIKQLNEDLIRLFKGEEVEIPIYDFVTGDKKAKGNKIKLEKNELILLEGIHGLNPKLTQQIAEKEKYKIYLSALTQIKIDDHNRISTTDNRLLRRMVRDYNFRGNDAQSTYEMWGKVKAGEQKYIFPYQYNADAVLNTALNYEIPVLKTFAEPLLRTITPENPFYIHSVRLQKILSFFLPIPPTNVPAHSLLREFIGGSGFKY